MQFVPTQVDVQVLFLPSMHSVEHMGCEGPVPAVPAVAVAPPPPEQDIGPGEGIEGQVDGPASMGGGGVTGPLMHASRSFAAPSHSGALGFVPPGPQLMT